MYAFLSLLLAACANPPVPTAPTPGVDGPPAGTPDTPARTAASDSPAPEGAPAHGAMPMRSDALVQDAFVWQRSWKAPLDAAVQDVGRDMRRLLVLAAEVSWEEGEPDVATVAPHWDVLAAEGRPIGIAVRSGRYDGSDWPGAGRRVAALAAERTAAARAAGIEVAELHFDFDSPTAKLGEYVGWLEAIRAAVPGVPLTITSLPTWQESPDYATLLHHVDGHVLQLHWLRSDPFYALLAEDPETPVRVAGRVGVPFRVALPTYGYLLGFGEDGKLVSIAAEHGDVDAPVEREVRAEPAEIAPLVARWARSRPAAMEGIAWFRLPQTADQRAWAAATLRAVMHGEVPAARLTGRLVRAGGGLWDVWIENTGNDRSLQPELAVCPRKGRILDLDATSGARMREHDGGWAARGTLEVGEARNLGWVRLTPGGVADVVVMGDGGEPWSDEPCGGLRSGAPPLDP